MTDFNPTTLQAYAEPLVALSTSHLTSNTGTGLDEGEWGLQIYPNLYGAFVRVPDEEERLADVPEELATVLRSCRAAGFVWVKFDRDACVVEGLATFDW